MQALNNDRANHNSDPIESRASVNHHAYLVLTLKYQFSKR